MKRVIGRIRLRLGDNERGATTLEYALVGTLIAVVVAVAARLLGLSLVPLFEGPLPWL